MRYLISVAAALALSSAAGSASAQGADWSGLYGGLSMATHDGGNYYDGSDTVTYDLEGRRVRRLHRVQLGQRTACVRG
ncbi:hypothetical protein [Tabrizicola caldifontis]|uniref:hypothetical protein n=1 Tax=Tabrizicola caldifontis TaxID=2528036 RepID=UPI001080B7AA|nr:hypothetical protein [Rhodobacter sp. YIM 73028]